MPNDRVSNDFLRTADLGRRPKPRAAGERSLREVGEFGLIKELTGGLPRTEQVLVGLGDDAAAVALLGPTLISTDTLVEGVHFRLDWSSAHQVGRKSVAVAVADIEAMGGKPRAVVVAFSAPKELSVGWASDFMAGMAAEAELAGVAIVGGDTTAASQICITVTVIGDSYLEPVTRSGARPGDVVAYIGKLGHAAGGLLVLSRGFGSPRDLVAAQQVPSPPYGQGALANVAGATALIDVSDGLLADLGHIAEASNVAIVVDVAQLVIDPDLERLGAATGTDPMSLVLTGGEDHALVGCFPPGNVPTDWHVIGEVTDGQGVSVLGEQTVAGTGWDHFA